MGAHVSTPMYQRTVPQRYRLEGARCKDCAQINFPPKGTCLYCRKGTEFEPVALSGKGSVYSFTLLSPAGAPPEFLDQAATREFLPVVLVELDEGPRIMAPAADLPEGGLAIGMRVHAVFRRIYTDDKVVRYGFKFVPTEGI
jgi:uncharacterized protein